MFVMGLLVHTIAVDTIAIPLTVENMLERHAKL